MTDDGKAPKDEVENLLDWTVTPISLPMNWNAVPHFMVWPVSKLLAPKDEREGSTVTDEERLEQIRQLEEEIRLVSEDVADFVQFEMTDPLPYRRILARLESALADLKRGMKDEREAVQ